MSSLERIRKCGRVALGDVGVHLVDGVARYSGLTMCASIHACPVCSAKIRAVRADEIDRAVSAHLRGGGGAYFVTATVRHAIGHRLTDLLDVIAGAWSFVLSGRKWAGSDLWLHGCTQRSGQLERSGAELPLAAERSAGSGSHTSSSAPLPSCGRKAGHRCPSRVWGHVAGARELYEVAGIIRALDFTVGRNGWHPHLHNVLLTERPLDADELAGLDGYLTESWVRGCELAGKSALPGVAVRIEQVRSVEDVSRYLVKTTDELGDDRLVGNELTRNDLKNGRRGGRTPWEVLASFMETGDLDDLRLWGEYERATQGRQAVTWSAGLKARYAIEEVSDDDAAEERVGDDEPVAIIPADVWARVVRCRGLAGALLRVVEVEGAPAMLRAVMRRLGGSP